jgi:hypothetical protein
MLMARRCHEEIRPSVRRLSILFAVLALASSGLLLPAQSPAEDASGSPTPPPKQNCGQTKSKYQKLQCDNYNNSAPGDEYFGRDKESYLGIENTFRDGYIRAGDNTTDPRVISTLNRASDALVVWSTRYPKDPELARAYYLGIRVYTKVYTQSGQQTAWQYMQTIVRKFPHTYFGKTINASLSKGDFTEHWYADAVPCPMPGATADPTATPAPPAKGQPAVELIEPPCTQFATDTPEATPTPVPSKGGKNPPAPIVGNPPVPAATSPPASPAASPVATGKVPGPNPPPPGI